MVNVAPDAYSYAVLEGSGVCAVAWSPRGLTATRFAYGAHRLAPYVMKVLHPFSVQTEDAVVGLLSLCDRELPPEQSGRFFRGEEREGVPPCNDADARKLWDLSAELVGVGA